MIISFFHFLIFWHLQFYMLSLIFLDLKYFDFTLPLCMHFVHVLHVYIKLQSRSEDVTLKTSAYVLDCDTRWT
jgi:hypothetical protein